MNTCAGVLAVALLTAFSNTTFASTTDDGSFIKSAGFCYMYSTRLTQINDSGLQIRGVNLFNRFNSPVFQEFLRKMDNIHSSSWVNSIFQKGNMEAMGLSASELKYNNKYFQLCNEFADSVEGSHGK